MQKLARWRIETILMSWSRKFDDPVPGLKTLKQAADYIMKLPKAEQELPHWQAAIEALIMAAEQDDAPTMMARIGMLRALNFGKPAPTIERKKRVPRIIR